MCSHIKGFNSRNTELSPSLTLSAQKQSQRNEAHCETMHALFFIGRLIVGSFTTLSAEFSNHSSSNNSDVWFSQVRHEDGSSGSFFIQSSAPSYPQLMLDSDLLSGPVNRASRLPVSAAAGCHPIIGNYVQMIAQRQLSLNGFSFCVGWGKHHRQDPEQACCQKGLEEKCFFWFSRVVSLSWVNEARAESMKPELIGY